MEILATSAAHYGASTRRRSQRPEVAATRLRILRAAERLYAERGFDGASLREIAIVAGQGNNNAVQYHFGNRDRLIEAIFEQRVHEMEAERQAMLEQAEADGRLHEPALLLCILSMPHLSLCDDRGHHPHAGFMLHYLIRRKPDGATRGMPNAFAGAPAMFRLLGLIQQRLTELPADIAQTRMTLCALMFLNLLVQHDAQHADAGNPVALARKARDTISAMTAALCGPCGA